MALNNIQFFLVISTENVEADAFFCFTNLMSEIRDNFIKTLDDSACGIGESARLLRLVSGHAASMHACQHLTL